MNARGAGWGRRPESQQRGHLRVAPVDAATPGDARRRVRPLRERGQLGGEGLASRLRDRRAALDRAAGAARVRVLRGVRAVLEGIGKGAALGERAARGDPLPAAGAVGAQLRGRGHGARAHGDRDLLVGGRRADHARDRVHRDPGVVVARLSVGAAAGDPAILAAAELAPGDARAAVRPAEAALGQRAGVRVGAVLARSQPGRAAGFQPVLAPRGRGLQLACDSWLRRRRVVGAAGGRDGADDPLDLGRHGAAPRPGLRE